MLNAAGLTALACRDLSAPCCAVLPPAPIKDLEKAYLFVAANTALVAASFAAKELPPVKGVASIAKKVNGSATVSTVKSPIKSAYS